MGESDSWARDRYRRIVAESDRFEGALGFDTALGLRSRPGRRSKDGFDSLLPGAGSLLMNRQ